MNTGFFVIIGGAVVVIFLLMTFLTSLYRKVPPNQALIVYGVGGTRIYRGQGTIIWPIVQTYRELSLELMSFDVAPSQDLYTMQGVAVTVEAVAQIKIRSDPDSIQTAAEQFLTKPVTERERLIQLVMEGHLRGIVGQLTIENLVKEPEMVSERVRTNVADDLSKMGLEVISFTIREVRDNNEYITNMGRPDIARIRKEADIARAEADRDTAMKRAQTMREAAVATAQADQERVIAETISQTKQAEAIRDLELKKAEYETMVKKQKAQADAAYEIETNIQKQRVTAEEIRIDRVRKEEQVQVQEMEILRREKELQATVQKLAEAERSRIETMAEAERKRRILEASGIAESVKIQAEGNAQAARAQGSADADVIRIKGMAEAEIIFAKGKAEADEMKLKASAFRGYNQAAVLDKFLGSMPELARAMAEPLNRVDKITIVSTGDGHNGFGASTITGEVAKMVAQAPALFEGLTGTKIGDFLAKITPLNNSLNSEEEAPAENVRLTTPPPPPANSNGSSK